MYVSHTYTPLIHV